MRIDRFGPMPVACALAVAALCAGCGSSAAWVDVASPALASAPVSALALVAAFDRPPDELVPLMDEAASAPSAPAAAARGAPAGAGRIGVRFGSVTTVAGDDTIWSPSGSLGVYYRDDRPPPGWFAWEIGLDVMGVTGETSYGGTVTTGLSFLRVDALIGSWGAKGEPAAVYAVAGLGIAGERATWDLTGEIARRSAFFLDLGVGVSAADGRWDVRLARTRYSGPQNARGTWALGLGMSW